MKKKNILILLIISMLFCISSVKAKTLTCEYEEPSDTDQDMPGNLEITFKTDDNGNYSSFGYDVPARFNGDFIVAELAMEEFDGIKYINTEILEENSCKKSLYVCKASKNKKNKLATSIVVGLDVDGYSYIMKNPQDPADEDLEIPMKYNGTQYYIDYCAWYDCVGKNCKIELQNACTLYTNLLNEMRKLNSENNFIKYNKKKDELITFCQNIISNSDYEIDHKVNKCYSYCLKIDDDFSKIENSSGGKRTCGFSQRLIVWAANIVKWIKYIIPVIVIVLGIIDFIKAIASSSDDEMKKAQGRFIKRLVAAALIFIIPFIIEFILDKTGFSEYVSGCGVIDL